MTPEDVFDRIRSILPESQVEIDGADCNFNVRVVSTSFSGKRLVQRQQSILGLFTEELTDGRLHALSVDACTPEEFKSRSALTSISL